MIVASGGNAGHRDCGRGALGVKCEVFVPTVSSPAKQARLRAGRRRGGHRQRVRGGPGSLPAAARRDRRLADPRLRPARGGRRRHAGAGDRGAGRRAARQRAGQRGRRRPDRGRGRLVRGPQPGGRAGAGAGTDAVPCARGGRAGDVAVSGIAADSLGARRIGAIAWEVSQRHVPQAMLLPDEAIRAPPTRPVAGLQAGRGARGSPGTGGPADACLPAAGRRDRGAGAVRREPGSRHAA